MNPSIPSTINVNMDVPVDFKALGRYKELYLFNLEYKVCMRMDGIEQIDGTIDYTSHYVYAISELPGGIAYFEGGWRVFDLCVQEKYADYIAEREILGDKSE